MPDPVLVTLPKDVWTKVANNVTTGNIKKKKPDQVTYLSTYRIAGTAKPEDVADKEEGVQMFVDHPNSEEIRSSFSIDVYVMPVGSAAQVRADL